MTSVGDERRDGLRVPDEPTLGEVLRRLDRLDARLDTVFSDYETRLRRVERWTYAIPPTLLTAVAAVIAAVVEK